MPRFAEIIDQHQIKDHMQNALDTGKISHAYIISGEDDSGKEFVARAYAKALLCENREKQGGYIEACGKCHSCIQAESDSNPDIITVRHEKLVLSVDDIREQVFRDLSFDSLTKLKPYEPKTYRYKSWYESKDEPRSFRNLTECATSHVKTRSESSHQGAWKLGCLEASHAWCQC